jgi:hypothetical protein
MTNEEALPIFKSQLVLNRTASGRPMTSSAESFIISSIDDTGNYAQNAIKCLGCGLVFSSLLSSDCCPNCNVPDLTLNIEE